MTLVLLRSSGAYTRMVTAGLTAQLAEVIQVWLIAFTTLCVLGLTTNDGNAHISLWVATWSLGTLLGFCLVRLIFVMQVRTWRRRGRLTRFVAVVDATGSGEPFGRKVTAETDAHLLGVFSARGADRGGIEALLRIARTCRVDDIFVTGSGGRGEELAAVLRKLGTIPANVHICTSLPASGFPLVEPGIVFGHPVVMVDPAAADRLGKAHEARGGSDLGGAASGAAGAINAGHRGYCLYWQPGAGTVPPATSGI